MYKLFRFILAKTARVRSLFFAVRSYRWYYGDKYIYGVPNNPLQAVDVVITAHYDTVVKDDDVKGRVFLDKKRGIIFGACRGDDRAGCFAVHKIITTSPHLPYVILCDEEESGGAGAREFINHYDGSRIKYGHPDFMRNAKFFMALDREGKQDAVYYTTANPQFEAFVEAAGFVKAIGTSSDIRKFEEEYKKCGVNLSIGYMDNHTKHEIINYHVLSATIAKATQLLAQSVRAGIFEYKEKFTSTFGSSSFKSYQQGDVWDYENTTWVNPATLSKKELKRIRRANGYYDYEDSLPKCTCEDCKQETKVWQARWNFREHKRLICDDCAKKIKVGMA